MVVVGLVIASMLSAPWITLSGLLVVYLVSIPLAVRSHRAISQRTGTHDDDRPIDIDLSGDN